MANYLKIFKKYVSDKYIIDTTKITSHNFSNTESYRNIMLDMYNQQYEQIIIDTELMLGIVKSAIKKDWVLHNLEIDDPSIDSETLKDIYGLVEKIKEKPIYFDDLKNYLIWASNSSLLINKITLAKKGKNNTVFISSVFSNGLLSDVDQEYFYEDIVEKEILLYLNGYEDI